MQPFLIWFSFDPADHLLVVLLVYVHSVHLTKNAFKIFVYIGDNKKYSLIKLSV